MMPHNETFQKWVLSAIENNLPQYAEFDGKEFTFSRNKIQQDARREKYQIIVDAEFGDPYGDKVCLVSRHSIQFFVRKIYKGKPTKEFVYGRGDDQPSVYAAQNISWYQNGEFHREGNKPAYLTPHEACWNVNGKWHRSDDGPTIINAFSGIKYHRNHDCWKRIGLDGGEVPDGWENGVMKWKKIE